LRPSFHFTAASGWINDPHGITPYDGGYHLFFQYVPASLVWRPGCHWGHAIGQDLFSWTELPVALAPGEGDDGIWTGSVVTDDAGAARILYTSTVQPDIGMGRVRVATPGDAEWIRWTKGRIVAEAPAELDIIAYRDPFVTREGAGWRMFVGAALADGTAAALSYRSADLESWQYTGIAASRSTHETEPVWTGALWECPQIFELDGRAVLVTSVWDADVLHYAAYGIGEHAGGVFTAKTWGRLTWGPSYYAPSYFRDAEGRPCLTFWLRGIEDPVAGWAGAHSVPHVLTIDGDRLVARPHPDLDAYRAAAPDGRVAGLAADAEWNGTGTFTVRSAGATALAIAADAENLDIVCGGQTWSVPHAGEPVRIVLDGPIAEVSTLSGLFAVPIEPAGDDLTLTADGTVAVSALTRTVTVHG
jgi:beta-fructofuranosidase